MPMVEVTVKFIYEIDPDNYDDFEDLKSAVESDWQDDPEILSDDLFQGSIVSVRELT